MSDQPQNVKIELPPENKVLCKCGSNLFHKVFETYKVPFTYRVMLNGADVIDRHLTLCLKCGKPQEINKLVNIDKKEKKDGEV